MAGHLPDGAGAPYERIAADLRAQIRDGRLPAGARLPSVTQLTAQYGVARMTVTSALRVLKTEGLLDGQQGRGVFVRPGAPPPE